jgi:two-component system sensor histidine kinase UhpB
MIDSASDYAIFTMSDDGHIDSWNTGAERLFGYSSHDIIGTRFDALFTPEDRAAGAPQLELERARRDGRSSDERYHVRRDGSLFYASGATSRLGDRAGLGFAKIARDLSVLQRAAQELIDAHGTLEAKVADRTVALAAEAKSHQEAQISIVNLLRRLVTAQEDERGRIARNLHDHLGQRLTALRLSLERVQSRVAEQAPADDNDLATALSLVQTIDNEVGFLAWELRPAVLDHLGLSAALPRYAHEWAQHYGIEVKYGGEPFPAGLISREAEIALYRIAQEALTNVAKHARAGRVDVLLERRDGSVVLVIEDDGLGFEAENIALSERGIGLLGMRERAGLIGAEFELESAPGEGTSIYIRYAVGRAGGAKES